MTEVKELDAFKKELEELHREEDERMNKRLKMYKRAYYLSLVTYGVLIAFSLVVQAYFAIFLSVVFAMCMTFIYIILGDNVRKDHAIACLAGAIELSDKHIRELTK